VVWEFVLGLDLSAFYAEIRSVEGHAGRPAIDAAILLSLWIYATSEGVGSARPLARLCEQHDAYRWICGGVEVSAHTLSDFRVAHGRVLDELLTQSVGRLLAEGLVELTRVAQDGMRVRAQAGAASFRRRTKLRECLREARRQVERLRRELNEDPAASSRRETSARERAARERKRRVEQALARMEEEEEQREERAKARPREEKKEPRVPTTDPEARVMRMADGGYRPAYSTSQEPGPPIHSQLLALSQPRSPEAPATDSCSGSEQPSVRSPEEAGSHVLEPDASTLAQSLPRARDSLEELGVVLDPVVHPGILVREADQHAGRPAVARNHHLSPARKSEVAREVILHLRQRHRSARAFLPPRATFRLASSRRSRGLQRSRP
jgi:transposase